MTAPLRGSGARCCSTTTSRRRTSSHHTTPALFRLAALGREELQSLAGARRPGARRLDFNRRELEELGFDDTGVLPIAVDTERITRRARRVRRSTDPRRRADQHPLRRPHRPQQENRGSHQAGRALQALRGRPIPLHLRRALRRVPTLLRAGAGADRAVSKCCRTGSGSPVRSPTRTGDVLPQVRRVHLAERARRVLRAAARGDGRGRAGARLRADGGPDTLGGAGVQFAPKDLEFAAELLGELVYDDGSRGCSRASAAACSRSHRADFAM